MLFSLVASELLRVGARNLQNVKIEDVQRHLRAAKPPTSETRLPAGWQWFGWKTHAYRLFARVYGLPGKAASPRAPPRSA